MKMNLSDFKKVIEEHKDAELPNVELVFTKKDYEHYANLENQMVVKLERWKAECEQLGIDPYYVLDRQTQDI